MIFPSHPMSELIKSKCFLWPNSDHCHHLIGQYQNHHPSGNLGVLQDCYSSNNCLQYHCHQSHHLDCRINPSNKELSYFSLWLKRFEASCQVELLYYDSSQFTFGHLYSWYNKGSISSQLVSDNNAKSENWHFECNNLKQQRIWCSIGNPRILLLFLSWIWLRKIFTCSSE